MEVHKVSAEVYKAVDKFAKNKIIGQDERNALEMIMMQDGIDQDERRILSNLDNKVAFSITDGKRTMEMNPSEVRFPAKPAAQQLASDRADPVRNQIYQDLMAVGIAEKDITATFSYLDKSGVKNEDLAQLVKNQLTQLGHKNPVYSPKDVLGAMQAYGVIQESLQRLKDFPDLNHDGLKAVAEQLKAGNYHISISPDLFIGRGVNALTDPTEDLIIQPGFDITRAEHRAIMLHELVHASHDVTFKGQEHLDVSRGYSEMDAHLAHGLYLVAARENDEYYARPNADEAPMVAFAESYREHVRTEQAADAAPADPALQQKARQAYERFSAHEGRFRQHLIDDRGYLLSFLTQKHADGISIKPAPKAPHAHHH